MTYILGTTRAEVRKEFYSPNLVSLYLTRFDRERTGERAELVWSSFDIGTVIQPTASLDEHCAQVLMDTLWEAGLRPTSGAGSAGAMAAVQAHLQDMRSLVFKGRPK